jgi:hypothetical protein
MYKSTLYFGLLLLISCSQKMVTNTTTYTFTASSNLPNYSNIDYWAAHPQKKDMSDNVPKPLGKYDSTQKQVDVFFIHPTTLTDYANTSMNADINDADINKKTDDGSMLYQASVFNESCNVYAPRYRQAHIKTFFIDQQTAKPIFDTAYADIKNAFEYYLQKLNNGKPIIIASHSQGTLHAAQLLKDYFENKPLQNKLVCAYIIGLPVFENYFSVLQPCDNKWQTGCFVTWRTFKSGYQGPDYILKEKQKSIVINPLTWTRDTTLAQESQNKGGVLKNFNKIVKGVVNAQIHKNILWSSKPKFFGNVFLTTQNYHIADYNFFYVNIRENVRERIGMFWKR